MSILSAKLVALRPVEADDSDELHRILNNSLLAGCRNVPDGYPAVLPLSAADARDIVGNWIEDRAKDPHYVVVRTGSGEVVGHANMGWGWDATDE